MKNVQDFDPDAAAERHVQSVVLFFSLQIFASSSPRFDTPISSRFRPDSLFGLIAPFRPDYAPASLDSSPRLAPILLRALLDFFLDCLQGPSYSNTRNLRRLPTYARCAGDGQPGAGK